MYDNTVELAENKLLLLYIIKSIRYTISNSKLTEIGRASCRERV